MCRARPSWQRGPCIGLLGLVACCTVSSASAGLDETAEQSQLRYGAPLHQGADLFQAQTVLAGAVTRTYRHHQWWIRAAFVAGKTARMTYAKADGQGNPAIQPDELQALLASEAGAGQWRAQAAVDWSGRRLATFPLQRQTFLNTNGRQARLEIGHTVVVIETAGAARAEARALDQQRQAKTQRGYSEACAAPQPAALQAR